MPSWTSLGLLDPSWDYFGSCLAISASSWGLLEISGAGMGLFWSSRGAILSHRGAFLGSSLCFLELSWAFLGMSWIMVKRSSAILGYLGAILGRSGDLFDYVWAHKRSMYENVPKTLFFYRHFSLSRAVSGSS